MGTAHKIIDGLRDALGYARCHHEFTVWEEVAPTRWRRICTKCKARETLISDIEPDVADTLDNVEAALKT